jgi:hypothetical protein
MLPPEARPPDKREEQMGATLKWKPVRPEGKTLSDATKYFFQDAYENFGDGKITLGASDVLYLRGAAVAAKDKEMAADIKTLIDAIEKFGSVEVWQEY